MKPFRAAGILIFVGMMLIILQPLFADPDRFTREEWFSMPVNHRSEYVSMAKDNLEGDGVPLSKSLDEYVVEVNDLDANKLKVSSRSVYTVLSSIVYGNEAAAREAMNALVKKNKIEKIETF